eukprot:scaffold36362_cov155-Skeletonema_dohrnii-CCMP3373.AAC.7
MSCQTAVEYNIIASVASFTFSRVRVVPKPRCVAVCGCCAAVVVVLYTCRISRGAMMHNM